MRTDTPPQLTELDRARGMRLWHASGGFAAVYSAIVAGAYATGFALFLGASNALVGLLSAAGSWGQLLQMVSPLLIERLRRRKPLCLAAHALAYGMWLPIALIPFWLEGTARPWAMIALVVLSGCIVAIAAPGATSWFTDLIPEHFRARFVSRNQSLLAGVGLVASLLAGVYMDRFPEDMKQAGFVSLFVVAVVFALVSVGVWSLVPEPPKPAQQPLSVSAFLTLPFRHRNFRNFTLFVACRSFAVMIAAPFFVVHMLENLEISYAQIALFSSLATVSTMAANPLWGYLAGKFGYKPLLRLGASAIALVPLLWFPTTKSTYLFIVPPVQIWAGVMGAGLILSQFNLMLKLAPEDNRSVYLGSFAAVVSLASALGAMTGGVVADQFARLRSLHLFGHPVSHLQCVFLVSAALRSAVLALLAKVREEHEVEAREVVHQVSEGRPVATFWGLIRMARTPDPKMKADAAKSLGMTRSPLATEELINLLDDSDRDVRREAARALGEIGDERAAAALVTKIGDPLADVLEESIESLGKVGSEEGYQWLVDHLADERVSVRKSAVIALGQLGDGRAEPELDKVLEAETDPTVVLATMEALTHLGAHQALRPLRVLLGKSRSPVARKQVANMIGNLLGPTGQFYQMLEAEPMSQEQRVARTLTNARRRLEGRRAGTPEDRRVAHVLLDAALQHFARRQYGEAVDCLRHAVMRPLRSFAASPRCARLLTERHQHFRPEAPLDKRISLLLETNEHLRLNFGFLSALHREAREREFGVEEMLLAVYAFGQTLDETVCLARRWK